LHIEHVIPISKGGVHGLRNIIPACPRCNFSKSNHEVHEWYLDQPFFLESRWQKILEVLNNGTSH
jgi:5-methylcytosine-specific restriction endonuclease McrA